MMKRRAVLAVSSVIALITSTAFAADLNFSATLQPGVTAFIHAEVLENPTPPADGQTILCLHGMGHSGNAWRPFAEASFSSKASKVILLNLPGRNGSSLPAGALFQDLTLQDYAAVLIQTLNKCQAAGIQPDEIVAHSMGGLIVQMAQTSLLAEQRKLADYGVKKVRLIGSSVPKEIYDPVFESLYGLGLVAQYTTPFREETGRVIEVNPVVFLGLFFSDPTGQLAAGTPPPGIAVARGYKADEALVAATQTVSPQASRPSVTEKAFAPANGTSLQLLYGAQDVFSFSFVQNALYMHLTGDETCAGITVLNQPSAVHDQFIIDPQPIIAAFGW